MRPFNALLAAIVVYMPYQAHYPVVLPLKGLNLMNLLFLVALVVLLARPGAPAAPTPLKRPFAFFIAMLTVAFLVGQGYDGSRFGDDLTFYKNAVFYLLFYFVFFHGVRDAASVRFLFGVILFVTVLVSVQAARQGLDYGFATFSDTRRASGPFAPDYRGANLAAAYFVIFVPLLLTTALVAASRPLWRLAGLAGTLLGAFGVLVTFSRQAYFILAVQFVLLALRRNLVVGIVLAAAILGYEQWAPEGVVERLEMTQSTDDQGTQRLDVSTESRFVLWEAARDMIAERPWGVGLARFHREVGNYTQRYAGMDAHNGFVLVAAECGVLGLAALLALLAGVLRLGWRVLRRGGTEDATLYGTGLTIAALDLIFANMFGSRFFDGTVVGNFWILAALVARFDALERGRLAAAP